MTILKIALDWTPNINHIGIFVAKALGFYQEQGIDLEIINPWDDQYQLTPGKKLELGIADFAIAPFETVISLNNKAQIVGSKAIFAILQEDISSIVTLKSSKLNRPQLLDGKIYASYKARYEDHIVKEMVKNDGGQGSITLTYPEKLGIWNTLLEGKADATWIFDNWEGIEAETKQLALNKFLLSDFGIPYGYSPVVIAKNNDLKVKNKEYANFIKATRQGYLYAVANQAEATDILNLHLTKEDKNKMDLKKSMAFTAPYFGNDANCGMMKAERIHDFLNWLVNHELEGKQILSQTLFTNELI